MHSSASVSKYKANVFQAEILSCRFDPTGQNIAACSADRSICAFCIALHFYSNKLTSIFLFFSDVQPSGGRILPTPTTASSKATPKRRSSTCNGRSAPRTSSLSLQTTLYLSPMSPRAGASVASTPTARLSTRWTGASQRAGGWGPSWSLQHRMIRR